MKDLAIVFILIAASFLHNILTPATEKSRRRIMKLIKRKYPSYEVDSLTLTYSDWSSTIREVDKYNKATSAEAVIGNGEEKRTLHFRVSFRIWRITHDAPHYGKNVPDGEYFMEDNWAALGQKHDIEESVRSSWVIPDENNKLYHISGNDKNWYYSYHYIRNFYRTENGKVYVLNRESFDWEPTEKTYSEMDYYGNYRSVPRDRAEKMIADYKRQFPPKK